MQKSTIHRPKYRLRKSLPFWLILPTAIVLLIVQFYPAFYTGWLSLARTFSQRLGICWIKKFRAIICHGNIQ